jgi:hypothetical protein
MGSFGIWVDSTVGYNWMTYVLCTYTIMGYDLAFIIFQTSGHFERLGCEWDRFPMGFSPFQVA